MMFQVLLIFKHREKKYFFKKAKVSKILNIAFDGEYIVQDVSFFACY